MQKFSKIAGALDKIADSLESHGYLKEAYELDKISESLEAMDTFPPEAVQLARELGITLNAQNAAEIVAKYLNTPSTGGIGDKEAMGISPKIRSLAMLAVILASSFISQVEAKGSPITVKAPQGGTVTYTAKDLRQLEKGDPKSFAIVMDNYHKQEAEHHKSRFQDSVNVDDAQNSRKPGQADKTVKNVEELKDAFGNTARLITYTDGKKKLEGDIMHGGVSLRDKLVRSGEIPFTPNAPMVKTDRSNLPYKS